MQTIYKCEFCESEYATEEEALKCEEECKGLHIEEMANLNYYIIKYAYPRLKLMAWYKETEKANKDRLVFLMNEYLYKENIDESLEKEMWHLFGELLPDMWN